MNQTQKSKSKFQKVINENNLCISLNPKGVDINWPKSYACLYYNKRFQKIYGNNKSPRILEINQNNKNKIKLWNNFFKKPFIYEKNIQSISDTNLIDQNLNFDIIFINKYKKIKGIFKILEFLKYKLNRGGIIIIENIHFNMFLVLRLFLFMDTKIYDFRINRFLINNCLIEIENKKRVNKFFYKFLNIHRLIMFLILDRISSIIVLTLHLKNYYKL